jgi:hypothetical protein
VKGLLAVATVFSIAIASEACARRAARPTGSPGQAKMDRWIDERMGKP